MSDETIVLPFGRKRPGDPEHDLSTLPQQGYNRLPLTAPMGRIGIDIEDPEMELLKQLNPQTVMMMGTNPSLLPMPAKPKLIDFFYARFTDITFRHLLTSGKKALDAGLDEKVVLACLLHDISNGCLVRADHGYWGSQIIAPYVDEEVAFAVKYHQSLRYFSDPAVGYEYPKSYDMFFGPDYDPPEYIKRDAEYARNHKWYMSARLVTMFDIYILDNTEEIKPELFEDIIGRHFKQPEEGLGLDNSPAAHMWRTMIWPNNFL